MIGRTLNGVYRVSEHVAGGGFADFYLGRDLRTNTIVGLKVLRAHHARKPEAARRFFVEARAAQSLDSPHVVRVLDSGDDRGILYIVMEYVEGHTLAELLAREGTLAPDEAVRIARQVLRGLEAAHRAGIIHRDVKPRNLIVTPDGTAKIADFGVARLIGDETPSEPQPDGSSTSDSLVGTASYISPEQSLGRIADARSDLYAVAAVLFELLAGRPPFVKDEPSEVLRMHEAAPAPRLSQFREDLPVGLVEAVARGLEKSPERRYQTAAAFRDALGFWEQPTRTLQSLRESDVLLTGDGARQPDIEETAAFSRDGPRRAITPGRSSRSGDGSVPGDAQRRHGRPVASRPGRPGRPLLVAFARVAVAVAVVVVAGLVITYAEAWSQLVGAAFTTVETSRSGLVTVVAGVGERASSASESVATASTELASQAERTATARAKASVTTAQTRAIATARAEDDSAATGATSGIAAPALRTRTPVPASATSAPRPTATAAPVRTPPAATATRPASATPADTRLATATTTAVSAASRAGATATVATTLPISTATPAPTSRPVASPTVTGTPTVKPVVTPSPTATPSTPSAQAATRQIIREYPERTASDPSVVCEIRQWSDGVFERLRCHSDATPTVPERQIVREYPERTADNPAQVCRIRQWSDGGYDRLECQTDPASTGSVDLGTPRIVREYPERTAGNPAEVCVIRQWSDGRYERTGCQTDQ